MRSKRICHVVQTLYAMDSRIRKQVETLANAGYDVDVVCLREVMDKPANTPNNVHFFHAPLSQRKGGKLRYLFEYIAFFIYASWIMTITLGRRYSVIHVSTMPDFLVFSTLIPKLFGARILLDVHDPMPELYMSKGEMVEENTVVRLLHWQERISFRFSQHLMTVSGPMRERVEAAVPGRQASVLMNLPDRVGDDKQVHISDGTTKTPGVFSLVYTGTLSPTYGLSMIIESVHRLKTRIPGIKLSLAGGGDDMETLRSLVEELGLQDRVEFLGWVPYAKLADIMALADVGVSCLKKDVLTDMCFNTKAADYTGMGLPAVVTRTRALEQHFPQGVIRLFEAGDQESFEQAIIELYENPKLRAEMSRKGIEFSKTANWSTEKKKYVELIEEMCSK